MFASAPPKDLDSALRVALQLEVWSWNIEQSSREITELEKKDDQTNVLKKQVAELQKQLTELQKKDQITVLSKQVAELEAQLIEAKSSTTTAPAPARNTDPPRAATGASGQRPTELIPPREGTCWECRAPGHRLWA